MVKVERTFYVDLNIYENNDSLTYYAMRAIYDHDPDALVITGTAAYYHNLAPQHPDTFFVVPRPMADRMLLEAASYGHSDAIGVIDVLCQLHVWNSPLPAPLQGKDYKHYDIFDRAIFKCKSYLE